MELYTPIPRDLTQVKSKILFGLTKRQLVCFGAAALIGVPSFFLLRRTGSVDFATMAMIIVMLPFFFFAMYEKNGEPLEKLLFYFIQARFLRPGLRVYQVENRYAAALRKREAEEEVERIVRNAQARQKER